LFLHQFYVHIQHNNIFSLQQIGIKPFRQYLRDESITFMINNPEGAKPNPLDNAQWIQRVWDQGQHCTILSTWQSIGIHPFNNK
jgi:hypothetical protein